MASSLRARVRRVLEGDLAFRVEERRLLARAGGLLYALGGTTGFLSLLFPGGSGTSLAVQASTSVVACAIGVALWTVGARLPMWVYQAVAFAATALTSVSAYYGGSEGWLNGFYYFWIALFAAYFFTLLQAAAQFAGIALGYGVVLAYGHQWRHAGLIWFVTTATLGVTTGLVVVLRRRLERALELARRQVERLRELDRLKDDFIATVSHELRTPVSAVYGAAETLRRPRLQPGEREQLLRIVYDEAFRLAELIGAVLQSTALDRGALPLETAPVDPVAAASDAIETARRGARARRIELRAQPGLPSVHADPGRLRQVLGNVLDNALKYSPESAPVELHVSRAGRGVRIVVRDEGEGIPPDERERVFDRFHRLDPHMRHGVGGTGLGLYIVRGLVEAMGGRVWIEPAAVGARGTTVVIELLESAARAEGEDSAAS